ncbi:hypothetical protein ACIPEN_02425 [Herbaspirillum chlorophenolicum]|uniref:Uncharacterized protein n=1 Tax=Herbaspirillum chlorophenolicum TaxID=211589 RepID=A0ABW8EV25_9BURK
MLLNSFASLSSLAHHCSEQFNVGAVRHAMIPVLARPAFAGAFRLNMLHSVTKPGREILNKYDRTGTGRNSNLAVLAHRFLLADRPAIT